MVEGRQSRGELSTLETTRGEKWLALLLAAFLLVGALWGYARIGRLDDGGPTFAEIRARHPAEQRALLRHQHAQQELAAAQGQLMDARSQLELRREAYRTELDAGRPASAQERGYRAAQRVLGRSGARLSEASRTERRARPAAQAAERLILQQLESAGESRRLLVFLVRLGYVLAALALAYVALRWARERRPRLFPLALAAVAAAAVQVLVLAADSFEDHVELRSFGPLALSLAGSALTVATFLGLQRYVVRRLPARRVRRGQCPSCGYPARGLHCEGCGRLLTVACAECGKPRREGSRYCACCGAGSTPVSVGSGGGG